MRGETTGGSQGMPHHNKKADRLQTIPNADEVSPDKDPKEIAERGSQDVQSVRAKNSGHGKKTADKWNQ
jgi:hypothetical protein